MDECDEIFANLEAIYKHKDDYIKQLENRILLLEERLKNPSPPAIKQTVTWTGPIRIPAEEKKKIMDEHYFKKLPYEQLREHGLIKPNPNPLRKAGII
jgi:hypothetical protein